MTCRRWLAAAVLAMTASTAAAAPPADTVWKRFIVRSTATGKVERFWVGHAKGLDPARRHGVVYFLPGLLDTEAKWKKALEPHLGRYDLIAVCPSVGGATWFMNSPAHEWMRWGDYLTEELRTFIESNFLASRAKGQRGIAGISAGAHGALTHTLRRPDLYGSVSLLSGALDLPTYAGQFGLDYWIGPNTPATMPLYAQRSTLRILTALEKPLPFALLLDTADKDGTRPQMEALKRILDARRCPYTWHEGRGAHSWTYWSSRAEDHLAWHADHFAENRLASRYSEEPPPRAGPGLRVLKGFPDITLSEEAIARLRAPWDAGATDSKSLAVSGLSPAGVPIPREGDPGEPKPLITRLTVRGHEPTLAVYRLALSVSTPQADAGTVTLVTTLRNGRGQYLLRVPATALPVPAGEPPRDVAVRMRLAVELKAPDPLRGGIVCGLQVFGADGQPVGKPVVGKGRPGTPGVEFWPLAPAVQVEWTLSLAGDGALRFAALRDAHLEIEPAP